MFLIYGYLYITADLETAEVGTGWQQLHPLCVVLYIVEETVPTHALHTYSVERRQNNKSMTYISLEHRNNAQLISPLST